MRIHLSSGSAQVESGLFSFKSYGDILQRAARFMRQGSQQGVTGGLSRVRVVRPVLRISAGAKSPCPVFTGAVQELRANRRAISGVFMTDLGGGDASPSRLA
jgi:hypothetical protein